MIDSQIPTIILLLKCQVARTKLIIDSRLVNLYNLNMVTAQAYPVMIEKPSPVTKEHFGQFIKFITYYHWRCPDYGMFWTHSNPKTSR